MKLWQAILIGCDRREQGFHAFFNHLSDGTIVSCALGAAYETMFDHTDDIGKAESSERLFSFRLFTLYPILTRQTFDKCLCGAVTDDVLARITHLNDTHMWSREKVALEFVRPLEEDVEEVDGNFVARSS